MPVSEESDAKFLKTQRKYERSESGKARQKRYFQSEAGKAAKNRYFQSERGQAALLRYYLSEKAESTRQKRQALIKLFRQADNWLKDNPDKTIEDFLNQ